ncbi:hypothetical protein [Planomicrobium okeanokoites]|uniref:Uncharacterized protein n=1 Tax=Planomicrobium okeanokoites TaxID=244 RepID=A0ABV7KTY2_PLAOK|nr:hypothetical protein [Planomicrobium okeanokoites]TAA67444.1 hypothetical protein D2910_13720 [Planomicrobium okeanokoites]
MFNEENIIDTIIAAGMLGGFLGLLFAGFRQEIQMMRKNETQIAEVNRTATNYGRKTAQLATTSEVIRKGHQ